MKAKIYVTLKNGVLDTQGKAIENVLTNNLGFDKISNVRQGKFIEMEINEQDQNKAKEIIDNACDKLLVNQVIEDYKFDLA